MRTAKRRRPLKRDRLGPGTQVDLEVLADRVSYVLTPEHKDYLTAAGPGKLRSDASACPRDLDFGKVAEWLKKAVQARQVSADFEGDFPRYVWTRAEGRSYEARLSNSGLGAYKGYPIHDHESPDWLR
jgi:hypothetical protein